MGSALPAEWYDNVFATDPGYLKPASESAWMPLWLAVIARIPAKARVLELGCGPGHLAELLAKAKPVEWYLGADFSVEAIRQCRIRNFPLQPHYGFHLKDLSGVPGADFIEFYSESVIVACEFLEHLPFNEDLRLLRAAVKSKAEKIILTLPTKDSEGHVLHFPTEASVWRRYHTILPTMTITPLDQWWIVEQTRSPK